MTISRVSDTNIQSLIIPSEAKALGKEVRIALKTLESTREAISSEITSLKKNISKFDPKDTQRYLGIINEAIAQKQEKEKLTKSISLNKDRLKKISIGIVKVKTSRQNLFSYIGQFKAIRNRKKPVWGGKLKKVKGKLPERYHGKNLDEVNDKLADHLDEIDDILAKLEKKAGKLEAKSILNKEKIENLDRSLLGAYKFSSLENLKAQAEVLKTSLADATETISKIKKLEWKLVCIDEQISEKRTEIKDILNTYKLEEESAVVSETPTVEKIEYITDRDGNILGKVIGMPSKSVIEFDFLENRSMTKWEQFKDFIFRIINAIKHLFRSPDLA